MTPFSFEWHWNVDYLVFMGLLYIALTIVACGLIYCLVKTWMDLSAGESPPEAPPEQLIYRTRYQQY
ncbi:MAG: hypothetical protein DRH11_14025 [Deltaproteobacteria bacterium]|nr:MAG: hypothetical protein DRH11_14025 [Deltaproteobacteria bacterium]